MEKHAYLIMAHHRGDLLKRLVAALDHERNDIYIHLDVKCKEPIHVTAQKSKLVWLPRTDVRWGGYSQIRCELALLRRALDSGTPYAYLHLLTGASYPIKDHDYIFQFFQDRRGKEFIGFTENAKACYGRVAYKHLFNETGKAVTAAQKRKKKLSEALVRAQRALGLDFFKRYKLEFKKGLAYWSITRECAQYICGKEALIKKMMRSSLLGDEVFMQTLVYNSPFRERIYDEKNEAEGACICAAWESCVHGNRPGQNLALQDYRLLFSPGYLYALKFEGRDGPALMALIDRDLLHLRPLPQSPAERGS